MVPFAVYGTGLFRLNGMGHIREAEGGYEKRDTEHDDSGSGYSCELTPRW